MVRTVVLKSNAVNRIQDDTDTSLECVSHGPVDLYLSIEDYKGLEKVIGKIFDQDSVRRIKDAMKAGRKKSRQRIFLP